MSATPQNAATHLKYGVWGLIVLTGIMAVTELAIVYVLFAEIGLVDTFGFRQVPREMMQPYIDIGRMSQPFVLMLAGLRLLCFGYFLFWTAKSLDLLDIRHRFSRLLSALSIIIPFANYYLPWATLGETRRTYKSIVAERRRPPDTIRRFDGRAFLLGLSWFAATTGNTIVAKLMIDGPMDTAQNWSASMASSLRGAAIIGVVDVFLLAAIAAYGLSLLALYRQVLMVQAADVFAPDGTEVSAQQPA